MNDKEKIDEIWNALTGGSLRGGSGGMIHEFKNMRLSHQNLDKRLDDLEDALKSVKSLVKGVIYGMIAMSIVFGWVGVKEILSILK